MGKLLRSRDVYAIGFGASLAFVVDGWLFIGSGAMVAFAAVGAALNAGTWLAYLLRDQAVAPYVELFKDRGGHG